MNKIHLIGNLTHDPELSVTASGIAVCNFSIAVNRSYKNADGEREADFFNCKAWRKLGDTVKKYVKKGNKISVLGHVVTGVYEDDKGNKKNSFTVIVDEIEFLTPATTKDEGSINEELQLNKIFDEDIPF